MSWSLYILGCLLSLKLACFSHNINVPKFWNTGTTDAVGADILSQSQTEGIPQCMEIFLDNKMHIISKSPEIIPPLTNDSSTETASLSSHPDSFPPPPPFEQQYPPKMDDSFYSALMMTTMPDLLDQATSLDDIMNVTPCPTMSHTLSSPTRNTLDPSKRIYPPMPAAEAIHYLQQKNKGRSYSRFIFTPSK